jgi:hypothetical protein
MPASGDQGYNVEARREYISSNRKMCERRVQRPDGLASVTSHPRSDLRSSSAPLPPRVMTLRMSSKIAQDQGESLVMSLP